LAKRKDGFLNFSGFAARDAQPEVSLETGRVQPDATLEMANRVSEVTGFSGDDAQEDGGRKVARRFGENLFA
jgi:hypothetical protein